jgi:hypothetical protein
VGQHLLIQMTIWRKPQAIRSKSLCGMTGTTWSSILPRSRDFRRQELIWHHAIHDAPSKRKSTFRNNRTVYRVDNNLSGASLMLLAIEQNTRHSIHFYTSRIRVCIRTSRTLGNPTWNRMVSVEPRFKENTLLQSQCRLRLLRHESTERVCASKK